MQIAIIGAGNIGGTIGRKWAAAGHTVRFGVRSPGESKFDDLRPIGDVLPVAAALEGAEVILLSLPGGSVAEFVQTHAAALDGKIVIDAANNFQGAQINSFTDLKQHAPAAKLVRAFNSLGWESFETPTLAGVTVDHFFCADPAVQETAARLIREVGPNPICLGGVDAVAAVDGLLRAWFALAYGQGLGRRIAFKLLSE